MSLGRRAGLGCLWREELHGLGVSMEREGLGWGVYGEGLHGLGVSLGRGAGLGCLWREGLDWWCLWREGLGWGVYGERGCMDWGCLWGEGLGWGVCGERGWTGGACGERGWAGVSVERGAGLVVPVERGVGLGRRYLTVYNDCRLAASSISREEDFHIDCYHSSFTFVWNCVQ